MFKFLWTLVATGAAKELLQSFFLNHELLPAVSFQSESIPHRLEKREGYEYYEINTTSFQIYLRCQRPFGDILNGSVICNGVQNSFKAAAKFLENQIHLPKRVTIVTRFESFCTASSKSPLGTDCLGTEKTLGSAAPVGMHQFKPQSALNYKLDPNYGYPSALARQYLNDSSELQTDTDISAKFNSDYNWLLYDDNLQPRSHNFGDKSVINGGFYNQSKFVSYDLAQVATHEFLHGMGFISSWTIWDQLNSTIFPSYALTNRQGVIVGMLPQWIFDRLTSDGYNNIWLSTYANTINKALNQSYNYGSNWSKYFVQTNGYAIGMSLLNGIFTTPESVLSWYPNGDNTKLSYAVLYTAVQYQPGSSLSHLDLDLYQGLGGYLMRPTASRSTILNEVVPSLAAGLGEPVLGILRAMGYAVYV